MPLAIQILWKPIWSYLDASHFAFIDQFSCIMLMTKMCIVTIWIVCHAGKGSWREKCCWWINAHRGISSCFQGKRSACFCRNSKLGMLILNMMYYLLGVIVWISNEAYSDMTANLRFCSLTKFKKKVKYLDVILISNFIVQMTWLPVLGTLMRYRYNLQACILQIYEEKVW